MPSIAFDIVGTCFDYGAGQRAIEERLGNKFKSLGINVGLFYSAWRFLAERDSMFLRMIREDEDEETKMKNKIPFKEILKLTFNQTLIQSGFPVDNLCSEEDLNVIIDQYGKLQPREGMEEMFTILRENGFEIWACSDAEVERVQSCFSSSSIKIPENRIISGHSIGCAKPQKQVYQLALNKIKQAFPDETSFIFAAAHAYDLSAAKKQGFQTAFTTVYEGQLVEKLWGQMDIVESSLPNLARAIVAKYGSKGDV